MKACPKCGQLKADMAFSKRSNQKDGLSYMCRECCAAYNVKWQKKNKGEVKKYHDEYYLANQDTIRARINEERKSNPEKYKAIEAARRKANPGRCRESKRAWEKRNPAAMAAKRAKRKAVLQCGQPPWVTQYKEEMKQFYISCRENKMTADHIVPLQGKSVSGFHVPWNMQMLTLKENSSKGNRLVGTPMFNLR